MRNMLIAFSLSVGLIINAQQPPADSVAMTVAGKQVSLGEFEFIAAKNSGVDLSDEKSLKEYVELFKNFKLKVAEAEEMKIDTSAAFREELDGYKAQLIAGYFRDIKAEEEAAKVIYDRGDEYLSLSVILFPLDKKCLSKDTVAAFQSAMQALDRIRKGEDFDEVGAALAESSANDANKINYGRIPSFQPLEYPKALEDAVYSLQKGDISRPVRTLQGFYLVKVNERMPDPGKVQIAHLRIPLKSDKIKSEDEALKLANEIYTKGQAGESVIELMKEYGFDEEPSNGVLPPFGPGQIIKPVEDVAFSIKEKGGIAKPFLTEHGYHIVQMVDRIERPPFEQDKSRIIAIMSENERNFDLFKGFVERLKKEYGYTFYPEAYSELEKVAGEYFPGTGEFAQKTKGMDKALFRVGNDDVSQAEFCAYLTRNPLSAKTYAADYMGEIFNLFVREVVTSLEKDNLLSKHPEIPYLVQEYKDGMLLFEISNQKVWSKPVDEQPAIEEKWIAALNKKYNVSVNWNALKKLKK